MRIPFTNLQLSLSSTKYQSEKRGVAFGKFFSTDPRRDFTGYRLSVDSLFNIYRMQGDVYACVRELKEGIGRRGYEWHVAKTDEQVARPDLDAILSYDKPWRRLKAATVRDLYVAGNAFWTFIRNLSGQVIGIQKLDPRTMAIVASEHGDVVRYIQSVAGNTVSFEPEEIVHFIVDEDPQHELFGLSPLESVIWDVRTDIQAMISNYAFFENDAQPAAYYILDDELTLAEQKEAMDQVETNFKGAGKRHKSGFLMGVKEIKTVAVSQKDMEFIGGRKLATSKICAAYGVPPFMIGYSENVNYQNSTSLMSNFAENTITPAEDVFSDTINRSFLPKLGITDITFQFNPQNIDEERDLEERALREIQYGLITPRQYKVKTRQEITEEDEESGMFDKHIAFSGAGAVLLEDIGVDPNTEYVQDDEAAKNKEESDGDQTV